MTEKPISSPMKKCDATIVTKTKSSQNTNCDHSGVFNDANVTSLMTTSLLVDEILIYSKNEAEHAKHLRIFLQHLRDHKLYAKFFECEFWLDSVKFLGHTISKDGISVDHSKVQEVMDWKPTKSVHQIRSFLGLAGYYRRFIPDFSIIAQPMTKLLKKGVKFVWSEDCEKALHTLRENLTSAPVLTQQI
jgi:hypothetical protein